MTLYRIAVDFSAKYIEGPRSKVARSVEPEIQDLAYLCSAEDADAEASGAGGSRGNRRRTR